MQVLYQSNGYSNIGHLREVPYAKCKGFRRRVGETLMNSRKRGVGKAYAPSAGVEFIGVLASEFFTGVIFVGFLMMGLAAQCTARARTRREHGGRMARFLSPSTRQTPCQYHLDIARISKWYGTELVSTEPVRTQRDRRSCCGQGPCQVCTEPGKFGVLGAEM